MSPFWHFILSDLHNICFFCSTLVDPQMMPSNAIQCRFGILKKTSWMDKIKFLLTRILSVFQTSACAGCLWRERRPLQPQVPPSPPARHRTCLCKRRSLIQVLILQSMIFNCCCLSNIPNSNFWIKSYFQGIFELSELTFLPVSLLNWTLQKYDGHRSKEWNRWGRRVSSIYNIRIEGGYLRYQNCQRSFAQNTKLLLLPLCMNECHFTKG